MFSLSNIPEGSDVSWAPWHLPDLPPTAVCRLCHKESIEGEDVDFYPAVPGSAHGLHLCYECRTNPDLDNADIIELMLLTV